jgi:hypothetical protein
MSRLYVKTKVDASKTANDSKLAAEISVTWPKGAEFPELTIVKGDNINEQ